MKRTQVLLVGAGLALLAASPAFGHPGHGEETAGFVAGFAHPMGGLDHLLAMLAVGAIAWRRGGAALLALPGAFVTAMALGGLLALAGVLVPFAEAGILVSVGVLGAAVLVAKRAPIVAATVACGVFAVFHGYAHLAEVPTNASTAQYFTGALTATLLLHALGAAAVAALLRARQVIAPSTSG